MTSSVLIVCPDDRMAIGGSGVSDISRLTQAMVCTLCYLLLELGATETRRASSRRHLALLRASRASRSGLGCRRRPHPRRRGGGDIFRKSSNNRAEATLPFALSVRVLPCRTVLSLSLKTIRSYASTPS
jgi:hypothetical protein